MSEPEADPETGSVTFEYAGSQYTMVYDMKAIQFFEREADQSIVDALGELEQAKGAGKTPKVSLLALLMQAGLRRHHPEVSAERALRMASVQSTQRALGLAVSTAAGPADASAEGNAPARGKAKGSTSPRAKGTRSKQG